MLMTLKINKPHAVISRAYYQPNKTISRPPKSRETIPLNKNFSRLKITTNDIFKKYYSLK
jgi:hypothetical protein